MPRLFQYLAISIFVVMAALPALAQPPINEFTGKVAEVGGYDVSGVTEYTLSQSVGRVIKVALSLVGLVFLILTIYAGILWMTAGGNEETVTKASNIFKTATIGLIIIMASYGLTVFVLAAIGAAAGVPVKTPGDLPAGPGQASFWSSFGKTFKDNWWKFLF